jgi:CBS domain-containing protein
MCGVTVDAGSRFLAAFNEIEDHFRNELGVDDHAEFMSMAREYAGSRRLPKEYRDELSAFAALRNAIVHGRYYGGRPIAEPVAEVVDQIERLRDRIVAPPAALRVLSSTDVCTTGPDEPISSALDHIRRLDYSQLPVYDGAVYAGILTTNAIARWLAAQLTASGGLAEAESVRRVLTFAEPHERALHVPKTITAAQAIHHLSSDGHGGGSAVALIITQSGKIAERPLAVVVRHDLPTLMAALAIH